MAYCWYRASKALPETLSFEEKIKACLFICETTVPQVLHFLPETWQQEKSEHLSEEDLFLKREKINFKTDHLISFATEFSEGINKENWLQSMLQQPGLFIRVRKNKTLVEKILKENNVVYTTLTDECFSLQNGTAIDQLLPAETYVVQDASSQETGNYFKPTAGEYWWDCCSGAGGKSLLLKDKEPSVHLTVSDKRASILHNLTERFKLYGHKAPEHFVADVANSNALQKIFKAVSFQNIICDVPCTGSGTWARTPEQLYFFKEEYLREFSEKQKLITTNVLPYLQAGGRIIYITCSVFKEENEDVVNYILKNHQLVLEKKMLINGIADKADSMFVAVLKK